jgi:transposase
VGGRYVGIDLHRRRSVIYTMDADGERVECVRIANDAMTLLAEVCKAGPAAEVVIEATYGWYWAVDLLRDAGFNVHLAHPSGNDWGQRRVKNDERDARDLADLLRLGRLAEAWIAPPAIRELRELVRYRAKLVQLRSGLKAQVHAVMAKEGVLPRLDDMFGPGGQRHLNEMQLGAAYTVRVESLRDLIEIYDREVTMLERKIHQQLRDDRGYQAIQALHGVGRTMAAIFVAEIGDVTRFRSPEALCSWAGLAPWHRESDIKITRGGITKMGSRLVRWAALEAIVRYHGGQWLARDFHRIAERRGKNKARVAVARKLLTLVYYGLRDGEIRCLRGDTVEAEAA